MSESQLTIAVIGGTGNLGQGLAYQFAKAGHRVIIGSRLAEKAEISARKTSAQSGRRVRGLENNAAAAEADLVFLTVPYSNHRIILESIYDEVQGKIFVDTTVPLNPPAVSRVHLPEEGMVAEQSQKFLGENVRVVSAFQNVAAAHLKDERHQADCDVLVCGNDPEARKIIIVLAEAIGFRALEAGTIENSAVAEALTSVLIFMNRLYKIKGAGIRITGEAGVA